MDGRTRWILSMAAAVSAAALVVIAVLLAGGGESCEEWQERYEAAVESMGGDPGAGTLQFINMGPLAGLEESKPEGCATPG